MIAEFCIIPLGGEIHFSSRLGRMLLLVEARGLDYRLGSMGTSVEGSWEEVMGLIKKCLNCARKESDRVWLSIKIDDKRGKGARLAAKVESVVRKSGRALKT